MRISFRWSFRQTARRCQLSELVAVSLLLLFADYHQVFGRFAHDAARRLETGHGLWRKVMGQAAKKKEFRVRERKKKKNSKQNKKKPNRTSILPTYCQRPPGQTGACIWPFSPAVQAHSAAKSALENAVRLMALQGKTVEEKGVAKQCRSGDMPAIRG